MNDPILQPLDPWPDGDPVDGDTGICRTCASPITYTTREDPGFLPRTGWRDDCRVDQLICFKAVNYRHVPLAGREAGIWNAAIKAATKALTSLASPAAPVAPGAENEEGS